jgi:hypothetical protein
MSGHKKWETIIGDMRNKLRPETIAYVQGYILAMEDVLKDIGDEQNDDGAFDLIILKIEESIEQAKRTLEVLNGN